ncbi:unnamed protein product, partial [marine sediment metagenome]
MDGPALREDLSFNKDDRTPVEKWLRQYQAGLRERETGERPVGFDEKTGALSPRAQGAPLPAQF